MKQANKSRPVHRFDTTLLAATINNKIEGNPSDEKQDGRLPPGDSEMSRELACALEPQQCAWGKPASALHLKMRSYVPEPFVASSDFQASVRKT